MVVRALVTQRTGPVLVSVGNPTGAAEGAESRVGGDLVLLSSLQVACEKTVSAMHHVLQRTIKCAKGTA